MAQDIFSQFEDKEEEDDPFASFVDIEPEVTEPPTAPRMSMAQNKPEPTLLEKIDTPLTDLPSRAARPVADMMDQPILNASPEGNNGLLDKLKVFNSQLRGFGAGALQGLSDVATRMTSPLELGMAAATGGASIARRGGLRGLSMGLEAANLLGSSADAGLGAKEIIESPDNSGRLSGLARIGGAGSNALGGLKGLRKVTEAVPASTLKNVAEEIPIPATEKAVVNPVAESIPEAVSVPVAKSAPEIRPTQLPKDLAGAKPRFNFEVNEYIPEFDNDVDKALYILAQKTPSKRNSDYLKFAMQATGLSNDEILREAAITRNSIKKLMAGAEPGNIKLPKLYNPKIETVKTKPKIKLITTENGTVPDLNDPVTASIAKLAEAKKIPIEEAEPVLQALKETPLKVDSGPSATRQFWDLAKGTLSVDLPFITSAGLRQGRGLMLNKNWWAAWEPSVKAYGSDIAAKAHLAELRQNKYFKEGLNKATGETIPSIGEEYGIILSDGKISKREEAIRSQLAEKIPGFGKAVKASNRSFEAYINDLRVNTFHDLMEAAIQHYEAVKAGGGRNLLGRNLTPAQIEELNPMTNKLLGQEIADRVMELTGRGKLETKLPFTDTKVSLEQPGVRNILDTVMFSPSLTASRLQALDPRKYIFGNPVLRRQQLRAALSLGVSTAALSTLGEAMGFGVSMNPTSADFGKARVGNTRIDMMGGYQQPLVAAMRALTGQSTSSSSGKTRTLGEGYKPDSVATVAGNYAMGRAHPMVRFAIELAQANKNQPFPLTDKLLQLYIPMITQDAAELGQEDPRLLALLPMISAGAGSQTYGEKFQPNKFLGKNSLTGVDEPFNVKSISPGQWFKR